LFRLPFDFVDVSENLVMANNVATPLNPRFALVEKEKLDEASSLDVNVSQWSRVKEPSKRVVHI
jgi:hypothetical protein